MKHKVQKDFTERVRVNQQDLSSERDSITLCATQAHLGCVMAARFVADLKTQVPLLVDRLRIADASILPRVTTGNTMAPCVVIGERAADVLRTDRKL